MASKRSTSTTAMPTDPEALRADHPGHQPGPTRCGGRGRWPGRRGPRGHRMPTVFSTRKIHCLGGAVDAMRWTDHPVLDERLRH
jgi:hypothetical protein